jgi:Fn3 associated
VTTISTTTSGATICYTTDGTTPIGNGGGGCIHGTTYSTAITLGPDNATLKAIGTKDGYDFDSAVKTASYVFD